MKISGRCLNAPVTRRWRPIKPARNNRYYLVHTATGAAGASGKIAETIVMERTRKTLHLPVAPFARGVGSFNFDSARRRVNAARVLEKKASDSNVPSSVNNTFAGVLYSFAINAIARVGK